MKRSLFLTACFMIMCSCLFGQNWTVNNATYESNMSLLAKINIENADVTGTNYEVAAFYNDEVRAVNRVENGYVSLTIQGRSNEQITFKLYDHSTQQKYATDYKVNFKNNGLIGNTGSETINFHKIYWDFEPDYELNVNMTVTAVILKDGEVQNRSNLEVAAYINGEQRAVAKPVQESDGSYLVDLFVCGIDTEEKTDEGEKVTFKIYDFDTETEYDAEYTTIFEDGKIEGLDEPVKMKFITRPYVAQVGEEKYQSLKEAIGAADGKTVTMLEDIELAETITVEAGKTVTLDLNGKTITGTDNATGSFGLITNRGNLTVTGNGTITLTATNNRGWNAYSSVISNNPGGKLVVENGTIEHLGGTDMAYAIDNLTNGKGTYAETVVNGGTVKSPYRAIRQFLNGVEAQNILTVNGGTIEGGNKSIWMQDPSANANSGKLTVGADASLKGDAYLSVTAGSTEWPVEVSIASAALKDGSEVLTNNVPATYAVEEVENVWGVYDAVATVNGVGYTTVTKAINAAQDGDKVQLLAGTINEVIKPWAADSQHTSEKSITIVGAENFGTTLTGGLYLGYDDSGCRAHTITIKGIAFEGKGILVAGQQNVVIEGNKFTDITELVATRQSATENAISVIGKNVNATVTGNIIDGTNESGIHLRDVQNATVTNNTVANTKGNSITINPTSGSNGEITVENNTLSNWGLSDEGRAMRISGGATVKVNGNVMSNTNAPEEFVKITGATTVDASKNYWNGVSPLSMFNTDLAKDPVEILVNYYTDVEKNNLVGIEASVAMIGAKYYHTFAEALVAVKDGETINLVRECDENVKISQETGLSFTINGNNNIYKGTITIEGDKAPNNNNTETLTFTNINFTPAYNTYAITATRTYARNITVDNCTFEANNDAYGIRVRNGYNYTVKNTTAEGMYTFFNASEALSGLTVENVTVKCSNVAFSAAYGMGNASFKEVIIESDNNGVKVNNPNGSALTFNNCSITAKTPVTFLESAGVTSALTAEFNGTNTMVVNNGGTYWFAIADDAATDATFKAIVNDNGLDMSNTAFEASIGNVYYSTLHKAIDVAVDGDIVTLARYIAYTSEDAILASGNLEVMVNVAGKDITLDMNDKKISLDHQSTTDRIYAVVSVEDGASLTVTGNGSIDVDVNDAEPKVAYMFLKRGNNGKLVIENGNFHMDDSEDSMVYSSGDDVVIVNGGTFILDAVGTGNNGSPWIFNCKESNTKNVIVNGGTFNYDINHQYWAFEVLVPMDRALKNNGNGTWTVDDAVAYVVEENNGYTREVGYATLEEALASEYGNDVTMLDDVVLTSTVNVPADKTIILDLNGKTIDGTGKVRIAIMSYGDLTVKDSSTNGTIKAGIGTAGNAINICGGTFTLESGNIYSLNNAILIDEQAAEINVKGGKITAEPATRNSAAFYISSTSETVVNITDGELVGYNGILLWNNTEINITGGTINATGSTAIQGNGSKDNTEINISGGTLSGYYAAIYHPQGGELNISGGELTGWTGVVVKGGTVNISGGTLNGTGTADTYRPVSSGYVDTGDGLYVEHYDNSTNSENYGTPVVTVTGGTFTSVNAKPIASYVNNNNNIEALARFVIGGTFNKEIEAELCALGYICIPDGNGAYTIADDPSTLYITNLDELKAFRDDVNAGNDYAGITVYLAADIDMAGVNWSNNIGDDCNATFDGTFDGQGHKLMNLTSTETAQKGDVYICTGLFGAIHGNAVLKNFTIENVTINTGDYTGNNVSAVVGFAYNVTGSIENVKVTGSININAPKATGVGAIIGYDYYSPALTVKNCVVAGNAGSTILGKSYVGGAVGYASAKIALNENTVENVSVTATGSVGAIAGIMLTGGSADANTVKNVALVATGELWANSAAVVAGTITSTGAVTVANTTVENVTANGVAASLVGGKLVEKPTTPIEKVEARIGNKYYATLEGALVAEGNEVTLLVPYVVEAGETVVLDLNGKTVTGTPTEAKAYAVITNNGNLTIEGEGSIICNHTLAGSTGYAVNTITNCGTLTIDGATISNTSTATNQIGYAIDNNSTTGNAVVVVKSGAVRASGSNYYDGIRQFCNSLTNENDVTIEGGEVSTLWMQNPSDGAEKNTKDVKGSFSITGGKVGVVSTEPSANFTASITAGEITKVEHFQTADGRNLVGYITGGTFGMDVTDPFCAENYSAVPNYDNDTCVWIVKLTSGTLTRYLEEGWNWFSSFIDIEGPTGLGMLESALNPSGIQIKDNASQKYVNYSSGNWRGSLTATSSTKMYAIKTSAEHTLNISGNIYDANDYNVELHEKWNYLSYPLYESKSLETAFRGFAPANGDQIKTIGKTAWYNAALGKWLGSFDLEPGVGYMYYSNEDGKDFSYSTEETRSSAASYVSKPTEYWIVNESQYPNNMTMIATLDVEGTNYEVAAFVDGELRGSARPIYVEELDQCIILMTISGENVGNITFKYYDHYTSEEYTLNNVAVYSNNAILGSVDAPYALTRGTTGIGENSLNDINIYPNPTTTDREINLQATCDKVEVFNTLGVKVAEYQNVDTIDALETAGTYVIRLTLNGDVKHCRLIVR